MDPKQVGDARSRLATVMKGEKVGIDNWALTQMVNMIIKNIPIVSFARSESPNLSCVYEDHYHVSVRLTEEVEKYGNYTSLNVEYTVEVNVPKTGDNENDTDAILTAIQETITSKRKKNRTALTPYVTSLPE